MLLLLVIVMLVLVAPGIEPAGWLTEQELSALCLLIGD